MAKEKKFDKIKYNNNFIFENYDRINLTLPKGQKEEIQNHANSKGETVNGFIKRAITETIKRERDND